MTDFYCCPAGTNLLQVFKIYQLQQDIVPQFSEALLKSAELWTISLLHNSAVTSNAIKLEGPHVTCELLFF